jgi:hypothetical protein
MHEVMIKRPGVGELDQAHRLRGAVYGRLALHPLVYRLACNRISRWICLCVCICVTIDEDMALLVAIRAPNLKSRGKSIIPKLFVTLKLSES